MREMGKLRLQVLSLAVFLLCGCECRGEAYSDISESASFRWELNGRHETRFRAVSLIGSNSVYSVRFRAALMNAVGGQLLVEADGVRFQCMGDGFSLENSPSNPVIPGQLDDRGFDFSLRNRCYHDFVFICLPDRIILFGDGNEKHSVLKSPLGKRGFRLIAENVDVDVVGFESAEQDMRGRWTSRNMLINGGFEQLNNGFPPYWTTYNFGFGSAEEIANMQDVWARYHVDAQVSCEGKNSMFLKETHVPLWECWMTRPIDEDYVFSIYAKTDTPGVQIKLMADSWYRSIGECVVAVPETGWTRFALPFRSTYGSFRCGVRLVGGKGHVWLDAAQVEKGKSPSPFVTHFLPRGGVPPNPPRIMDHYYANLAGSRQPSGRPPRMTCVDPSRNSFRFNGKEYFMYGFTGFMPGGDPVSGKALDCLREWGCNVHVAHGAYGKNPVRLREALDACLKRGIMLSVCVRYDHQAGRVDEAELSAVAAVSNHPALLSIDLFDECCGKVTSEKRLEVADTVRRHTGNRVPISFNEFDLGVIQHMDFSAADIASVDLYVIGQQEVSAQYYILKQFRDDNPDRVISFYPMSSGHFATWPRDPTREEVLAQAYIAYVLEIYNLKWWQAVPTTKMALEGVIQAKRERDIIDPSAFLDGEPVGVKCESRNDAVKFTARRMKNGVTRLVVVNIENRSNAAMWTLPSEAKAVKALIGKGPAKIDGVTIKDAFGPLERRVYDIGL